MVNWVRIEDTLPEPDENGAREVLCFNGKIFKGYKSMSDGDWYNLENNNYLAENVTHWHELQPPSVENQELEEGDSWKEAPWCNFEEDND